MIFCGNKPIRIVSALGLLLLCALAPETGVEAQGLDSHEHGRAEINVVMVGKELSIEFLSPAMNLLGFERAPVSAAENSQLDTVAAALRSTDWLLGDALAQCEMRLQTLELPEFQSHSEHHGDNEHEHDETTAGHADFFVQYQFTCPTQPDSSIRILAFERFGGIESITVQWIANRQQGLAVLTPGRHSLSLD